MMLEMCMSILNKNLIVQNTNNHQQWPTHKTNTKTPCQSTCLLAEKDSTPEQQASNLKSLTKSSETLK